MRKSLVCIILMFFYPAICSADTASSSPVVQLPYGFSSLTFNSGPLQEVKLDHRKTQGTSPLSLVTVAEAAVAPEMFEHVCNAVNDVRHLNGLKPFLTENAFQSLKNKVKPGVSQYTILAMFQSMRPHRVRIVDANIQSDQAELSAAGISSWGPVNGRIQLAKIQGEWKIAGENWFAGEKDKKDPLDTTFAKPISALVSMSPEYQINRNVLSLSRVPMSRRNRAFTFVFLMNKHKEKGVVENSARHRLHIMVPKAKKVLKDQKLIEHEYPIDVSVAKYEDGYATDEWNLVLPGKKPREVAVSLLWSF